MRLYLLYTSPGALALCLTYNFTKLGIEPLSGALEGTHLSCTMEEVGEQALRALWRMNVKSCYTFFFTRH
jgi:hypothetical protein